MKSIFISCVYEDAQNIKTIEKWCTAGLLGECVITYETEDQRENGRDAIRKHILEKIRGAAVILVLIGDSTHNHDWIAVEVELANSFNKKIICVRLPNTKGNTPAILNNYTTITFDPSSIKNFL